MRITAFSDGYRILDTSLETLKLISPKISQEDNKVGSFTFTIYPDHPYYNYIEKMKSIITVYEEGVAEPLFRGRVYEEKQGFYNEKQVSCEGELAFLLDSIQRPYSFPGEGQSGTPAELFTQYITAHNSQVDASRQFKVGTITVTDPNNYINRSNSDYANTWDELNNKLIKSLGGHLWVRHEADGNYIDYLADFNVLSNQTIEFGKNLLELEKNIKVDGFATALIPLGAFIKDESGNDTNERLTIKSVNNNVDYVYNSEAVANHGYIYATNVWDDVTDASNLKRKGQAFIDNMAQFTASIDIGAADLNGATIDGQVANVNSFRIGRYVKVNTKPHSIENMNFIVSMLSRELLKPENTKLTLGTTYKTLTEKQLSQVEQINQYVQTIKKEVKGVTSITEQYYLSTSKVTPTGGSWVETAPTWEAGKYIWTRSKIIYSNSSTPVYTTALCDSSWEAVNEIQIGGRNLIPNTNDMSKYSKSTDVTISKDSEGYSVATYSKKTSLAWISIQNKNNIPYKSIKGKTVTVSFEYRADAWEHSESKSTGGYNYPILSFNITDTNISTTRPKYRSIYSTFSEPTTAWQKYVYTAEITDDFFISGTGTITDEKWFFLSIFNYSLNSMQIRKIKMEIGNKATDWTPAPEDVDSAIGTNVSSVDIYYYLSTSATTLAGGSWNTTAPSWENGKFIWQKTITTLANGTTSETTPVCITGAKNTAVQSTAPTDTTLLWLDTSVEPPVMKRWNGEAWVVVNDMSGTISQLEINYKADIETSDKSIKQTLTESYYTKDATNSLVSSVSSSLEHKASGFEMQFTNISKDLKDVNDKADSKFTEISKYIRFEDGNIILGEANNPLLLKIENDRIAFYQDNSEVAYFNNNKLYVTDGEFIKSIQVGNFAFIPRTNGNLSFKKIV